jgi:yeast amino acid transporter
VRSSLQCQINRLGPFNNGFAGLCSAFITAGFSLAGTELVGLAAAETDNPRRNVPRAAKQVFWRIVLFYFTSLTVIACIVPFNHPQLLTKAHSADVRASPFVIAIQDAGIKVLPHIINAVILISVLSVGNSSTYASTRTFNALAELKQAPLILRYIDRAGRPLASLVLCLGCGLLAYFGCLPGGATQLFDWLLQVSALSSFFTWGSICLAHIRYRAAMKFQGQSTKYVPFKACFGIWGSYLGLVLNISAVAAQIYVASSGLYGPFRFWSWFGDVVAVPVIFLSFLVWKVFSNKDTGGWVNLEDMDLVTGRRLITEVEYDTEREDRKRWNCWQRVVRFFC